MSRPIPTLKLHKSSGHGYVRIDGKQIFCGLFGSAECRQRYERTIAEWLARDRRPGSTKGPLLVNDLLAAFLAHAIEYYRDGDGKPTGEAKNFIEAVKPLRRLYGRTRADDFGAAELKAVRAAMIESGLSRSTINSRVGRIRRIWRWGAAEGLVDAAVHARLVVVDALRKNRTTAPEAPGVAPVAEAVVRATLPHMPPAVAAMVELQLLTGCRVGEVLTMRGGEIDRSGAVWLYAPGKHKNAHRGQGRTIPLGPRAQDALRPFLKADPDAFLFDPRAEATRPDAGDHYDRRAYAQAIRRACDRAFPHPTIRPSDWTRTKRPTAEERAELEAWRKAHRWSPLQIRHAVGTRVRGEHGLEAAQAVLGHAKADATQIYAERLDRLARDIAAKMG